MARSIIFFPTLKEPEVTDKDLEGLLSIKDRYSFEHKNALINYIKDSILENDKCTAHIRYKCGENCLKLDFKPNEKINKLSNHGYEVSSSRDIEHIKNEKGLIVDTFPVSEMKYITKVYW